MNQTSQTPAGLRSEAAGIVVIAATYIYFLIFAQFAFLHLAQSAGLAPNALRATMASMAISGIASALATGQWFRKCRPRRLLLTGFFVSALAAIASEAIRGEALFCAAAAAIGCSLGMLTVTVAASLPLFLPRSRMGLDIGIGTGLAYAICNIPGVFSATDRAQIVLAVCACGIGCAGTLIHSFPMEALPPEPKAMPEAGRRPFAPLVLLFLVLVWLDSAAFFIFQTTPALNRFGWEGEFLGWSNAATHFAAATIAGLWLDRAGLRWVLALAFAGLAGAILCASAQPEVAGFAHWLYTAGVSLYSAALVFAPSMNLGGNRPVDPAPRAAILYAVAGWLGSALGIGMAQDLHLVPSWFLWLAGAVFFAGHWRWRTAASPRALVRQSISIVAVGALTLGGRQTARSRAAGGNSRQSVVSLGRDVYISEGCIHCHSQYVRPGTADETWWGPSQTAARVLREEPPLIGNRRQGPDLMNIGNRRSPDWNRAHLMNPRALIASSRMPSYAHLFTPGDPRGQALVAYLCSLGADTFEARSRARERWRPGGAVEPVSSDDALRIFQANCVPCHGQRGKGDGPLARRLGARAPRDLTQAHWLFLPPRKDLAEHLLDLARVIKFGIPGTSMPGHETFTDAEVLGVSAYVESLQLSPRTL